MDSHELALAIFIEFVSQTSAHNLVYVTNPHDMDDLTLITVDGVFDFEAIGQGIEAALAKAKGHSEGES